MLLMKLGLFPSFAVPMRRRPHGVSPKLAFALLLLGAHGALGAQIHLGTPAMAASSGDGHARQPLRPHPRGYVAHRLPAGTELSMSGRLRDAAWSAAPWSEPFLDILGPDAVGGRAGGYTMAGGACEGVVQQPAGSPPPSQPSAPSLSAPVPRRRLSGAPCSGAPHPLEPGRACPPPHAPPALTPRSTRPTSNPSALTPHPHAPSVLTPPTHPHQPRPAPPTAPPPHPSRRRPMPRGSRCCGTTSASTSAPGWVGGWVGG
jgi:hypothetical protein